MHAELQLPAEGGDTKIITVPVEEIDQISTARPSSRAPYPKDQVRVQLRDSTVHYAYHVQIT